ncbi:MAG TPA: hypothetical protein EYN91_08585 [Candidatus Melainabacteria bacterium]|nr:hypothetical protein [Candidatus Melainabacteria bacterium]HIN63826.1 hypothetical protein [Candidatus Obscuribacterales bacterium]
MPLESSHQLSTKQEERGWLNSAVNDAFSVVSNHPIETAVATAGLAGAGALAVMSKGKLGLSSAKTVALDEFKVVKGNLPDELQELKALPIERIVELKDGVRALVDKDGFLIAAQRSGREQNFFVSNKSGSLTGYLRPDSAYGDGYLIMAGSEAAKLARSSGLAHTAQEANGSKFLYDFGFFGREYTFSREGGKALSWKSDGHGLPYQKQAITAFESLSADLERRAMRLYVK